MNRFKICRKYPHIPGAEVGTDDVCVNIHWAYFESGVTTHIWCFIFCLTPGGGLGGGAGLRNRTKRKTHQGERLFLSEMLSRSICFEAISSPLVNQEEDALSYVAGFTVANDVSARDWQMKRNGKQWLLSKTFDSFCPLGPALVTTDAVKGEGKREGRVGGVQQSGDSCN